ncbi:MAG TPA: 50S ribosomal protein L4 [Patescibacteria group bacterium]|nr:50S ribosomal protein L4 [Patescibacteria group bacterium]
MKYAVHNQQGEEKGTVLLPKEIFELPMNSDLVHQVAISQMANRRIVTAQAKNRGEVRGGGRKPWRQKGTGRARHGSRRSPIWRGGGVTFGPTKDRVFKKKINKKMKKKALFMVLSEKAKSNLLVVLDELKLEKAKTKSLAKLIENFKKGSFLIALPKIEKNVILASRNLTGVEVVEARNLNVLDLLSSKYLMMPKESIKVVKEIFSK